MILANSPMQGFTWRKQALVRSPRRAKELCLTSGIVSWKHKKDQHSEVVFFLIEGLNIAPCHTCMHWKRRVMMFERATSCSTWPPRPSASPLSRSRATIMKSLSGASYWSGCWLYICVLKKRYTMNIFTVKYADYHMGELLTMAWARVFWTRVTQRW